MQGCLEGRFLPRRGVGLVGSGTGLDYRLQVPRSESKKFLAGDNHYDSKIPKLSFFFLLSFFVTYCESSMLPWSNGWYHWIRDV